MQTLYVACGRKVACTSTSCWCFEEFSAEHIFYEYILTIYRIELGTRTPSNAKILRECSEDLGGASILLEVEHVDLVRRIVLFYSIGGSSGKIDL